eukprot:6336982-Amphidinium_carterae.1
MVGAIMWLACQELQKRTAERKRQQPGDLHIVVQSLRMPLPLLVTLSSKERHRESAENPMTFELQNWQNRQ